MQIKYTIANIHIMYFGYMKLSISTHFNDFISLVFPVSCTACKRVLVGQEEHLCTFCRYNLPYTNFHLRENNPVEKSFWGRVPMRACASFLYFTKEGRVQEMLHQLKYHGNQQIGIELGKMYGIELKRSPIFNSVDLIIPVPLHPIKLSKRGYNQSEIFAHGLSQSMNIPINTNSLIKSDNNGSQTKLGRYLRWKNVESAFAITNEEQLKNKHILLVDDVVTTGSTIESCANKILSIQGTSVSLATIAIAKI